ncbi:transposase [Chryseobacterium sp. PS-8]|uniref:Transposase n=1 Tax=Chryseobacterium indicum TaxID=2766954 RepID=A0ABS9C8Z4_9FLAO|nr:transposase [Chryseobacterium sp. PS-8]MCF2220644.1 transposase [Chryseobacterium sp. PS-8]
MNLKTIHIGKSIEERVQQLEIPKERICKFLNCEEEDLENMYKNPSMDTEILLRWSKLLEYDFFRLYVGHLILYAPPSAINAIEKQTNRPSKLPIFRKNIYTQEIKDFILSKIDKGEMSVPEIIETYKIPKTTLYKWVYKSEKK